LRFSPVVVAALLSGACAAETGDPSLEVVFDPCRPVSLLPAADASADELAGVDSAIEMWSRTGIGALARAPEGAARDAAAELEVRFEEASPIFYGVYDDESGVVFINRRLGDDHARAVTIAHEVGHALGLPHISDRDSVMNPENLVHEPNADDAGDLQSLWGDCALGASD
jgi:Matrixin